jgi:hypothetical protein
MDPIHGSGDAGGFRRRSIRILIFCGAHLQLDGRETASLDSGFGDQAKPTDFR